VIHHPTTSDRLYERALHALRVAEDLASAIQDRIEAMRIGTRPVNWPTIHAAEATLREYREFAAGIPQGTRLLDEEMLHAAADWSTR
jgi:hypothetical protein